MVGVEVSYGGSPDPSRGKNPVDFRSVLAIIQKIFPKEGDNLKKPERMLCLLLQEVKKLLGKTGCGVSQRLPDLFRVLCLREKRENSVFFVLMVLASLFLYFRKS